MRIRSLCVALVAGVLVVPVSASAASASASTSPSVTGIGKTFKTSDAKRAKRLARTAVPAVAPVAAPVAPAPAPATVVKAPAPTVGYADRVLALTNGERARAGLRSLSPSSCAHGFAASWARALADAGSLSHQSLTPILTSCKARGVGENVAYGNVTPEALVGMWMNSPGHRANILNPAFTHLGVGDLTTSSGRVYGVQVFLTL